MLKRRFKILLTGGHAATTAIALIDEIKKKKGGYTLYWIGPKVAIEGTRIPPSSARILPKLGVIHETIVAGRLSKKLSFWTIPSLIKIPVGFLHALFLVRKIQPSVIVSFGGYAALPVSFAGWLFAIPIVVHAQTVVVGLANRISAIFADRIAIARKESAALLPRGKVVLTGNPVMAAIAKVFPKEKIGSPATIYITGGSAGAKSINRAVDGCLERLLGSFYIIHQTGELDFGYFSARKKNLPVRLTKNYEVHSFISPFEISEVYKRADMLVSRAGANTISEIAITKRPALLIPHPKVHFDEQIKNAQNAEKAGFAIVLSEENLSSGSLMDGIAKVIANWKRMVDAEVSETTGLDTNAAKKLAKLIFDLDENKKNTNKN